MSIDAWWPAIGAVAALVATTASLVLGLMLQRTQRQQLMTQSFENLSQTLLNLVRVQAERVNLEDRYYDQGAEEPMQRLLRERYSVDDDTG